MLIIGKQKLNETIFVSCERKLNMTCFAFSSTDLVRPWLPLLSVISIFCFFGVRLLLRLQRKTPSFSLRISQVLHRF